MANEPDLSPYTSSEWVMYLQQLLNAHYQQSVVPESGEFDDETVAAVRHLRSQNGLTESDEVDQSVWTVLTGEQHTGPTSSQDPSGEAQESQLPWPELHSIQVWVNAFIPGSYGGNIDGSGAAAGHRLLPGPTSWFHDCFLTDDRDFSSDITASSRMHSEFRMELPSMVLTPRHVCGTTVEHDCEDGDVECTDTASTSRMSWDGPMRAGDTIWANVAGAANNPCFTGSPDIDYVGAVFVDLATKTITFEGKVNGFPAYEAYVVVNDGSPQELFTHGPSGDPTSLIGDADIDVRGEVSF